MGVLYPTIVSGRKPLRASSCAPRCHDSDPHHLGCELHLNTTPTHTPPNSRIHPDIELYQAISLRSSSETIAIASAYSSVGCKYPAGEVKSVNHPMVGQPSSHHSALPRLEAPDHVVQRTILFANERSRSSCNTLASPYFPAWNHDDLRFDRPWPHGRVRVLYQDLFLFLASVLGPVSAALVDELAWNLKLVMKVSSALHQSACVVAPDQICYWEGNHS
jgi:hypothetical protein